MRSRPAFFASLAFLLALPLALLCQAVVGGGAEVAIHVMLGIGSTMLAFAVGDFRTPRWTTWTAGIAAGALAAVFLLQAVALVVDSRLISRVAFDVLGQGPEGWLGDVVLGWFVVVLLFDSHGVTRVLGCLTVMLAIGFEIVTQVLRLQGVASTDSAAALKALFLLPFVWLLLEAAKKPPVNAPRRRTRRDAAAVAAPRRDAAP